MRRRWRRRAKTKWKRGFVEFRCWLNFLKDDKNSVFDIFMFPNDYCCVVCWEPSALFSISFSSLLSRRLEFQNPINGNYWTSRQQQQTHIHGKWRGCTTRGELKSGNSWGRRRILIRSLKHTTYKTLFGRTTTNGNETTDPTTIDGLRDATAKMKFYVISREYFVCWS